MGWVGSGGRGGAAGVGGEGLGWRWLVGVGPVGVARRGWWGLVRVGGWLNVLGCRTDRRFAWKPGNPGNRRSNGPFEITYLLTFGL
jgi:hypothetical protein